MKRKTVFIFGAGSTVALGMPPSDQHVELLREAAKTDLSLLDSLYKIVKSRFKGKKYDINDVYNLIDTALLLQTGLSGGGEKIEYIDVLRAKRELVAFTFDKFLSRIKERDEKVYEKYVDFYYKLAEKELSDKLCSEADFDDREFFISGYSIINFNWDIYSLFPIIEANRKLNHENNRYFSCGRLPQLRMYTDFNYECATNLKSDKPWYPFTEPAANIVNSETYDTKRRVILTKAYFPHGLMNSFRCPNCARHSLYLGELDIKSTCDSLDYRSDKTLYKCINCSGEISTNDFNVLIQSNFKTRNAFLEETRIKMFCELESAERLVFIGYSLPPDDTDYRTFFKSLCNVKEVYVVLKDDKPTYGFKKIKDENDLVGYSESTKSAAKRYLSTANEIYLNTAGFPEAAADVLNIAK